MKFISGTKDFSFKNTIITLGKFDGLHKGHRKLLNKLNEEKKNRITSVVFTFDIAPKKLISGEEPQCLLTREEKIYFHELSGIDVLIEYPFDQETSSMDAKTFVIQILVNKLGVKKIVCGTDFKFGYQRSGNSELLIQLGKEYGFEVEVLEKEKFELKDISSTNIKDELTKGNIEKVNDMLGYPFTVIGEVMHGNQLGRTIGTPTLNIIPPYSKLLPPNGVYSSKTIIEGVEYIGITNIGYKPTVSNELVRGVETHLFDFDGDLYGKIVEVQFYKYVRKEIKFDNVQCLKEQILRDIKICRGLN